MIKQAEPRAIFFCWLGFSKNSSNIEPAPGETNPSFHNFLTMAETTHYCSSKSDSGLQFLQLLKTGNRSAGLQAVAMQQLPDWSCRRQQIPHLKFSRNVSTDSLRSLYSPIHLQPMQLFTVDSIVHNKISNTSTIEG